jgi:membrane glycosyltransferase
MAAKPMQVNADDKWLLDYVDKLRVAGTPNLELEEEIQKDQADLTDVVEKQEEQVKKAASSPLPKTSDQKKQDQELNTALQRGKQQARKEQALHQRAKKMDAASDERVAKEKERELEVKRKEAEREEDKQQARSVRDVRHVTQGINQALEQNVNPLLEKAGTLPTLGGIGLMLGILAFLLVLIVPVNAAGDTRAKQFWYMLNGRAKLQGAVTPQVGSQIADFGTQQGNPATNQGNLGASSVTTFGTDVTGSTNGFRSTPSNLGF